MKKSISILLSLILVFSLAAAGIVCPKIDSQAATQKASMTLFSGESTRILMNSKIKSVKSSDAKVLKANKEGGSDYRVKVAAKKKGSVTVTIKTERETLKYKIKVLDLKSSFSFETLPVIGNETRAIVRVKNKTSLCITSLGITYYIKDSNGIDITSDEITISSIPSKDTAYSGFLYVPTEVVEQGADLTQTEYEIDAKKIKRDSQLKNLDSKVTVKERGTHSLENGTLKLTVTATNKASTEANVFIYVFVRDMNGNIIGYTRTNDLSLKKKKGIKTLNISVYMSEEIAANYYSHEIVYTAMH